MSKDIQNALMLIQKEQQAIKELAKSLNTDLTNILDKLEKCHGKIIITGMGKSGHIGRKIAASLASTGTPSFFVHPAEASHGDLGMITEKDIVIAISNSGESKELIDVINYCKRFNILLIGITKNPESSLGKACEYVLCLPDVPEACPLGLAPTCSTTATLVLGDVLTVCLMERKRFTSQQFGLRHPGGKLGSILTRVGDIMHKDMPLVDYTTTMEEARQKISEKGYGCVGLIQEDKLYGILTDGDIRRLANLPPQEKAYSYCTTDPIVINPNVLAPEALSIMNYHKITNMFVVEDKKPIGLIHIHDLLKVGC